MLPIKVQDGPRELRAAVLAMKRADKAVRADISQQLRSVMSPEWTHELAQHLTGDPREKILLSGSRIQAGNPPTLITASGKRRFGRGLIPNEHWQAFEYGASSRKLVTYARRNRTNPGKHKVTRDTHAGLPRFQKGGRVIGPSVAAILPRAAAFWVQSVVKAFMDAAEKKA